MVVIGVAYRTEKKLQFLQRFFCGEKRFKIAILSLKKIILQLCCQYSRK